jgi:hypothetical protein
MKDSVKQLIEEIEFFINLNDDKGIINPEYNGFLCHLVDLIIDEKFIQNKALIDSIEGELKSHLNYLHGNFEIVEEEKEEFRYETKRVKTGKTYKIQKLVRKSQDSEGFPKA